MSQPPRPFFTVTDFHSLSVTTALRQGDDLTIAKDDHSLSLPILIAPDIAAETIRLMLDEDDVTNGSGLSLSEWLGDEDSEELRHVLSRITGPEGPTFTTPHR
ncbi:MAG TPA: hypothetical protein VMS16_03090 [Mycobacterium sp.]|nr:hypothetical protein [Mycobacterium sp.]